MNTTRNPQRMTMRTWLILVVLGCCLAAAPFVFSTDLYSGGGTMAMAGVSIAVLSLIMVLNYRKRARLFDRMIAGEDLLTHWTYDAEVWRQYTECEFESRKGNSRVLWIVLASVFAVPAIGVIVLTGADAIALLGVFCFYLLLLVTARTISRMKRYLEAERTPEAYIAAQGALIGGKFHAWNGWACKVESAVILGSEPDMLSITYLYTPRRSSSRIVVRIPIPAGARKEAEEICAFFSKQK